MISKASISLNVCYAQGFIYQSIHDALLHALLHTLSKEASVTIPADKINEYQYCLINNHF